MNTAASAAILLPKAAVWARAGIRRDRANAYALLAPWTLPPLGGDLPRLGLMPPAPYADERIRVVFGTTEDTEHTEGAWRITVLPWELDSRECDGCTLAPDSWGELKPYVGALFHDRWYLSLSTIAKAWGWPAARVRKLGDLVFATILRDLAEAWALDLRSLPGCWFRRAAREIRILYARAGIAIYYRGVRAFGGIAHAAMRKPSSPGGGGGISPLLLSAPVALAGLLLFAAGCSGGCRLPNAWDDTVGFYTVVEVPAHSFTNTVTGAHFVTQSRGEGGDAEDLGDSASSASPRETEPEEAE